MFNRFFKWYLDQKPTARAFFVGVLTALSFFAFILSLIGGTETNNDGVIISADPSLVYSYVILLFITLGTLFLVLVDVIVRRVVSYITHGDHDSILPIGTLLFGNDYRWSEIRLLYGMYSSQTILTRWAAFNILFAPFGIVFILSISFFSIIPYVVGIAIIGGILWGVIELARYVYGLNIRFKNHMNDPDAHKKAQRDNSET